MRAGSGLLAPTDTTAQAGPGHFPPRLGLQEPAGELERPVWSPASGLASGLQPRPGSHLRAGELLQSRGHRVVSREAQRCKVTSTKGLPPTFPALDPQRGLGRDWGWGPTLDIQESHPGSWKLRAAWASPNCIRSSSLGVGTQEAAFHHTLLEIRMCNPIGELLTWASASEMLFCS